MRALIVGDTWPVGIGKDAMRQRLNLISGAEPDIFVWTLDAAAGDIPVREGQTHIMFHPTSIETMVLGKTNVAVAAANHINDCGDDGVHETLKSLKSYGIFHVGAGETLRDAEEPLFVDSPAGRIAFLAFAETEPWVRALAATDSSPGIRPYDEEKCASAVRRVRKEADHLWLFLHWGHEFIRYPEPRQRRAAKLFVESGATLVACSHTHVPMGYERARESVIFYGLGNFSFADMLTPRGYVYRWDRLSRRGLALEGEYAARKWTWTPREVRIDHQGLPRLQSYTDARLCPDLSMFGMGFPGVYDFLYTALRFTERMKYYSRRLVWMTSAERRYRIRKLCGGDG